MKRLVGAVAFGLCIGLGTAGAQTLPPGFVHSTAASGVSQPTLVKFSPDGRMWIGQKNGTVRIVQNGVLLPTAFMNLPVSTNSEQGLLGLAFDPNFASNQHIYVYYTTTGTSPIRNRVSRFTANGNVVQAGSEVILLDNIDMDNQNHNAGCLQIGPDGRLYIATGDGGSDAQKSQRLNTVAGKILRINLDGSIPTDNPFFNTAGARREIFHLGLRNPWRFAFRPGTSVMFIGDVGSSQFEEINVASQPGRNFGWPDSEGATGNPNFTSPIFAYPGPGTSVTGGVFVGGPAWPVEYANAYIFGDYIQNRLYRLTVDANNQLVSSNSNWGTNISRPVDFAVGPSGDLYYADIVGGAIRRISYRPTPSALDAPASIQSGLSAQATVTLNHAAPAGGLSVSLADNHPNVTVPATVNVAGGQTSATFTIQTTAVGAVANVTVTATANGVNRTDTFELRPNILGGIRFLPTGVVGGNPAQAEVFLSSPAPAGGAAVALVSSAPGLLTVPATATVPAGATTVRVPVTTRGVAARTTVPVNATYAGAERTGSLVIIPATLIGVSGSPAEVPGGNRTTITVRLNGTAPTGGAVVRLTSNRPQLVVPATVTIPAGRNSATVLGTTTSVTAPVSATLSATKSGVVRTAQVTVVPVRLLSVSVVPSTVRGGTRATGTVRLNGPAPAGGAAVALASTRPSVRVPRTVTIPAGSVSATFTVTTTAVSVNEQAVVRASRGAATATTTVTVLR